MGDVTRASDIASFLGGVLVGEDLIVNNVTALDQINNGALVFAKKKNFEIPPHIRCLVLCPVGYENEHGDFSFIVTNNPRLAFAKVVTRFFTKKVINGIHPTTLIGENCSIDPTVSIGANCIIGDNVNIGAETVLNNSVVIFNNTIIGSKCYIKSGTVIGEDGFGFDFEDHKTPVRIPHLGSVVIGNNVEIGAKNTIARGTISNTTINDNVKIDDQVHIAHNCKIGINTIITACAVLSGSVIIGKNCWLGPNCSIIQKVKIGDNVTIGIGAVVVSHVESSKKVMGLEALELRKLIRLKKSIEFGN